MMLSHNQIEFIGLLGGALFAAGCMPVAWNVLKTGRTGGAPLSTKWLLFGSHLPFWFLVIEIVCWRIDLWYKYFPRKQVIASNSRL